MYQCIFQKLMDPQTKQDSTVCVFILKVYLLGVVGKQISNINLLKIYAILCFWQLRSLN